MILHLYLYLYLRIFVFIIYFMFVQCFMTEEGENTRLKDQMDTVSELGDVLSSAAILIPDSSLFRRAAATFEDVIRFSFFFSSKSFEQYIFPLPNSSFFFTLCVFVF